MINEHEFNELKRRVLDLEASQNNLQQSGTGVSLSGDVIITDTIRATNAVIGDTENGTYLQYTPDNGLEMNWNDGDLTVDENGITVNDTTFTYKQTSLEGGETRQFDMGMFIADGGTYPSGGWQYYKPGSSELVTNGDFATGDFTGWTEGGETAGVTLSVVGGYAKALIYGTSQTLTLTSARITDVTTSESATLSAKIQPYGLISGRGSTKLELKWYDHASAGSLLRTDTLFNITSNSTTWTTHSQLYLAPTGALSCEIVWTTATPSTAISNDCRLDNVSFIASTITNKLYFEPVYGNLVMDNGGLGMWATTAMWLPTALRVYNSGGTEVTANMGATNVDVVGGSYWNMSTGNSNNGDYYVTEAVLAAGTYDLKMWYRRGDSRGMVDIYVDGTKVTSSPIDMYNASAASDILSTTEFTITKSGNHQFKFLINGKHASSSDYVFASQLFQIVTT